ncbi:MAG: hypothetical protein EBU01_15520 [Crocinitomicaceae bacterium]|nr:hypothetical protein [Crocinitomicaceae bacterium]
MFQNVSVVDSRVRSRIIRPSWSADLKLFLNRNPLPDCYEIISDLVLFGLCGYYDLDEGLKRIPILNCDVFFFNSPSEFIRFFLYPNSPNRLLVEFHSRLSQNIEFPKGMNFVKIVNGVTVKFYKEKPYRLYCYEMDEITFTPNSIGRKILSLVEKEMILKNLILLKIQKNTNPAVAINMDTEPMKAVEDENGKTALVPNSMDLSSGGINFVRNIVGGTPPVFSLGQQEDISNISEMMAFQNNMAGGIAIGTHNQATVGATKSNIPEGTLDMVNQIQDVDLEIDRREFLRVFFREMLFIHISNSGDFKGVVNNPNDLYFNGLDGDLNGADSVKKQLLTEVQAYIQLFGENLFQVVSPQKLVKLLKDTSSFDIFN